MTAQDRLRILYNIIARSGNIEDIDLSAELAKNLSLVNSMESQDMMQNMPVSAPNNNAGATISPDMGQSMGQTPSSPVPNI
jgi:hypothetical protein